MEAKTVQEVQVRAGGAGGTGGLRFFVRDWAAARILEKLNERSHFRETSYFFQGHLH
jgi:hypothetical protein